MQSPELAKQRSRRFSDGTHITADTVATAPQVVQHPARTCTGVQQLLGPLYSLTAETSLAARVAAGLPLWVHTLIDSPDRRTHNTLYALSVASLFVLSIAVWANDAEYPNQGLASLLIVTLSDAVLFALWRCEVVWTPLSTCGIVFIVRAVVACTAGAYWFVGASLVYFLLMVCVMIDYAKRVLRRLSASQIDRMSLLNVQPAAPPSFVDLSRNPATVLVTTSLLFLFVLLVLIASDGDTSNNSRLNKVCAPSLPPAAYRCVPKFWTHRT
jgi:hypothetical protein